MIVDQKEINKHFKQAIKSFKIGIELAKKNLIIGEIRFPTPRKARKQKKSTSDPATTIPEKPKKIRKQRTPKEKDLPDGDKNNPFYGGKKKEE